MYLYEGEVGRVRRSRSLHVLSYNSLYGGALCHGFKKDLWTNTGIGSMENLIK